MDRMTRRILLAGLPWGLLVRERQFEVFCVDEFGVSHAAVVTEWLSLPELRTLVGTLTPEFLTSFGIREMVQTPFGVALEKRTKEWKLLV
jgi:hypothetical protein